ncbi:TetR family transcriptional regulator [Rhodococcus rhodochrous J38]|uniref:TetR/AcrR family transcriptional regulator n=1 Tax=Rhodococcus rhodochrous TaxID=1829 RepID=UPI0011AC9E4C|nr:TetR/AcrR family transcriptional regulator [Rhodococcus rhodochrous]TWH41876.1 TetR family transcriptional regulator [Rhodococcus rhodochrous J38]
MQIANNARELFALRGFHAVRVDHIAEASGVTARAVYRHYKNKQELLARIIDEDQQRWIDALDSISEVESDEELARHLDYLARVGIESRRLSVLWQREARHLDEDDFRTVRSRAVWISDNVAGRLIRPCHPGLGAFATDVRSWAVVSVLTSPAFYDSALSRSRLATVMATACERIIAAPTVEPVRRRQTPTVENVPMARREQLLAAAAAAFRRSGYAGVSIDDIGADVGFAGPAIYRYFKTKSSILVALMERFAEWRALEVVRALRTSTDPAEVLSALISGYVRLGIEAVDLLAVALTERHYLPDEDRERFERINDDFVSELRRWYSSVRPDVDPAAAQSLVSIAVTVVHDLVRIPHFLRSPDFESELDRVVHALFAD